jgi:hypothetical protein
MTMPSPDNRKARVIAIYFEDPARTRKEIARLAGCSAAYVYQLMDRLDLRRLRHRSETEREMRLRPPVVVRPRPEPFRVDACQFKFVQDGELHICGAETKGKTYCPDCFAELGRSHLGSRYSFSTGQRSPSARFAA